MRTFPGMSGMREKDFVLRMIQQFADALARVAGLRRQKKDQEALQVLGELAESLFGLARPALDALDVGSVHRMLGHPEKTLVYAQILEAEAEITGDAARRVRAERLRQLAEGKA